MSELIKKSYFENIWNLLLEADTKVGLYLLKDPPNKKTLLEWIYKMTFVRTIILLQGISLSTLITTNFKLISVIFCASIESEFIAIYTILSKYIWNKEILINLLKWCEGLYDVEKKFHMLVQNSAKLHFMSIERQTTKLLKHFRTFMYVECFIVTFGWLIFGIIFPGSIFPKYSPLAPFYLPFENQNNWIAFMVTMAVQTIIIFDVGTMIIYIFSVFFTVVIHVLGYLDFINDTIKYIQRDLSLRSSSVEFAKNSQLKLDMNVLATINQSLNNKSVASFDEWIKIITEMISDVSAIISLLSKFYSMTFLSVEVASLASLFICGLILTVLHEQHFFAVGVNVAALILWIICYINEKILDKFDDIKASLYDIPWYELEVKQQKILLIALSCDEIQKGFTAAGIHNLTIERFGIVIKVGYTNVLILKDLVQK